MLSRIPKALVFIVCLLIICILFAIVMKSTYGCTGHSQLDFFVNSDGKTCTITGIGTYEGKDIEIPEFIEGYKVVAIGDRAFAGSDIERLAISSTLETIGKGAFDGCKFLNDVTCPNGNEYITSIQEYTFRNCLKLARIEFPTNLISIEKAAFMGCEMLVKLKLPNTLAEIGSQAFQGCIRLLDINIPPKVTEIKNNTFKDCYNLGSVELPEGLVSIGEYAFHQCWINFTEVVIPDSVTSIGKYAFYDCQSLQQVDLSNSITTISEGTFMGCYLLESIQIPDNVNSIEVAAFAVCKSIKDINIPKNVRYIETDAFSYCYSLELLTVDDQNEYYCSLDGNLYSKDGTKLIQYAIGKPNDNFEIPGGVTTIATSAFIGSQNLKQVIIGIGVSNIEKNIFLNAEILDTFIYKGTVEEWRSITKHKLWDSQSKNYVVNCSDGKIAPNGTVTYYQ